MRDVINIPNIGFSLKETHLVLLSVGICLLLAALTLYIAIRYMWSASVARARIALGFPYFWGSKDLSSASSKRCEHCEGIRSRNSKLN
jgi:hypothetical protein